MIRSFAAKSGIRVPVTGSWTNSRGSDFFREKEEEMKTNMGTKSDRRSAKKAKAGKPGRKALHCALASKNTGVNRDNTYAKWVAEMTSRGKTVHRG